MIAHIRHARWTRTITWLLLLVMVAPWIAGCAVPPEAPRQITLAGIVVDGRYLMREEASAYVGVWRDGRALAVQQGMALQRGDRIATGDRSEIVIRYPNGSELFMRARSSGRIGSISEAIGEFFAKVYGVFNIETEYVKAGARGTAFAVRAAPDGRTEVFVLNGNVEISSRLNAWRPVYLSAGSATLAHPYAPLPRRLSEAEINETRQWVERLEQQVPTEPAGSSSSGAGAAAAALAIGALAAVLLSSRDDRPSDDDRGSRRERSPGIRPSLTAPAGLRPGSTNAQQPPLLDCRRPAQLTWQPVAGAQDYVVTLESRPLRTRTWNRVEVQMTGTTSARTPGNLNTRLRWSVQARDDRGTGPASAVMYFDCSTRIIR